MQSIAFGGGKIVAFPFLEDITILCEFFQEFSEGDTVMKVGDDSWADFLKFVFVKV